MQGQLIFDSAMAALNLTIGVAVINLTRFWGALNIGFALYNTLSFFRHMN